MTSIAQTFAGFDDPVMDAQEIFRAGLIAMSRPGTITPLTYAMKPPPPLKAPAAGLLLTLTDFETKVWLDEPARHSSELTGFLTFNTGAVIVDDPAEATFALISDPGRMPPLATFQQGTLDYPDRSATLIIQADRLANVGVKFAGAGINGSINFSASPVPDDFWQQVEFNNHTFPLGVDLIFATDGEIAALPRSTRIDREGGTCM